MKKLSIFLLVFFLISMGSSFQQILAQEKTKAEKEKELKIQKEIDRQKKVMAEQNKAPADSNIARLINREHRYLKEQQSELDKTNKETRIEAVNAGKPREAVRFYNQRGNRSLAFDEPSVFSAPGIESFYGHGMSGDSERTTWEFSRSEKENTSTKEYTFDVEKSVNTVVMSVMGDCKAGEILINIFMPDGKSYSDIVIDELGNLNWRKSFTISGTENQDKIGEWKFQIASTKATGFFKISFQTY